MENISEKIPMIIALIIALIFCGGILYYLEYQQDIYYTRIDNTKIEELFTSDNMKYQYTLLAYNEKGKKKEFTFKTSRKLRNEAYLKLETTIFVGVRKWEEVQFDELSEKIKTKYIE